MKRLPFILAFAFSLSYTGVVVAIRAIGGEADMLRLATDWPLTVPMSYSDWFDETWGELHSLFGCSQSEYLEIPFVTLVYAGLGFLLGKIILRLTSKKVYQL